MKTSNNSTNTQDLTTKEKGSFTLAWQNSKTFKAIQEPAGLTPDSLLGADFVQDPQCQ